MSNSSFSELLEATEDKEPNAETTVRLTTSYWSDKRGIHSKRSLIFLRRRSTGYNILKEDADAIGVQSVFPRIINLDACADGIYTVLVCNERRDWESGYVEDYDYQLWPVSDDE